MINGPFIWREKAASLVIIWLMHLRATRDFLRNTLRLRQGSGPITSFGAEKAILYFESRPVRTRSIATSLSAFQIKKLGFFRPHSTYGTTK
jgi:hypothetical protein